MKVGCLNAQELQVLLDGTATESVRASAERHLDTCLLCRTELEALAGSADDFRRLQRSGGAGMSEATPALNQILRKLAADPAPGPTATDVSMDLGKLLHYLTVSERHGSLGRLADYEILEIVAAGGMGIVLRALDTQLNRIVAVKVMAPVLAADPRSRQRFLREARAVAAISHDYIVGIHSVGEANELPFIAMEFIEGESLAQRLKRDRRLPVEDAVRIGKEIARGLAAAHACGIIHRDIKPGNVLIERGTGSAKITDFGLARAIDDTALTRSGFIAGTPEYLSPEQAADHPLDARSDLFSLGCLLYAACVGESPFQASTTLAVLRRVADHTPMPVCQVNSEIPRWFSDVIDRLLAKNPADRFASAEELIKALDTKTPGRTEGGWVRRRLRSALIALLVLPAVVALVVFVLPPDTPRTHPFVVHGENGQSIGEYTDLEQALRAAPGGAIIDLRWNGEREMAPIELPGRAIGLRAAKNVHPIWVHRSLRKAALTASAALTIEGIEFRYDPRPEANAKLANVEPPKVNRAPENSSFDGRPSGASLIRAVGGSLNITRCLLKRGGSFLEEDDGFAGITLQGATHCALTDTALFIGDGKGLVCRGGQPSITISNCVLFASQSVWMDPGAPTTLHIERSSVKGTTFVHFPPPSAHRLSVQARSNLFNTSFIIVDQRSQAPTRLRREWLNWEDDANLYSLTKPGGNDGGFISFVSMPGVGPRLLRGWKDFAQQAGGDSWEAQAQFAKVRQRGSASMAEAPSLEDFRVTSLRQFPGGGPPPPPEQKDRFGANLNSVGPAAATSGPRR